MVRGIRRDYRVLVTDRRAARRVVDPVYCQLRRPNDTGAMRTSKERHESFPKAHSLRVYE